MWKVYIDGDTTGPHIVEDQGVLNTFLNQQPAGAKMMVQRFDVIQRELTTYNMTGSPPLPPVPQPVIQIVSFALNHYKHA